MKRPKAKPRLPKQLEFGLGLRPEHYEGVLQGHAKGAGWFEVLTENYLGLGGRPIHYLEKIREKYPVVLHGVSLSIGSVDPLDLVYVKSLKRFARDIEAQWISDHLCWTGVNGQNLHDLMPLPYTRETLRHVVARIGKVQDLLGRELVVENVSSYLEYAHSEMPEWEFVAEVSRRSGCGLLLDLNNVYVSSVNHGFDPHEYLDAIPKDAIRQFHLAGHSIVKSTSTDAAKAAGRGDAAFLIDTHDQPVCDEVWDLYANALSRFGFVPTMVERDANIPKLEELELELARARQIAESVLSPKSPVSKPSAGKKHERTENNSHASTIDQKPAASPRARMDASIRR